MKVDTITRRFTLSSFVLCCPLLFTKCAGDASKGKIKMQKVIFSSLLVLSGTLHAQELPENLSEMVVTATRSEVAKNTILPPSKFGLVQVTRQRVRPEMNIVTVEK